MGCFYLDLALPYSIPGKRFLKFQAFLSSPIAIILEQRKVPGIRISNFRKFSTKIETGYYIDKTMLIKELDKKFDEGEKQIEKNAYAEKYEKLHFKLHRFVIVYPDMIATIKKV